MLSTKVQILTPEELKDGEDAAAAAAKKEEAARKVGSARMLLTKHLRC